MPRSPQFLSIHAFRVESLIDEAELQIAEPEHEDNAMKYSSPAPLISFESLGRYSATPICRKSVKALWERKNFRGWNSKRTSEHY